MVTIGFDPVEYDPVLWNRGRARTLIHIDCAPADISGDYRPDLELLGDIAATLEALTGVIELRPGPAQADLLDEIRRAEEGLGAEASRHAGTPIHPLKLVHALQGLLDEARRSAATSARSTSG